MYSSDELKEVIKKAYKPKDYGKFFEYKQTKRGISENWQRKRVFQCILYPDSMISSVDECAKNFAVPIVLGLHDMDLKEDGSLKKKHYHGVAQYSGKKTLFDFYTDICSAFGEKSWFGLEYTSEKKSSIEYLIHKNDKDKYQYSIDNVTGYNGMVYLDDLLSVSGDIMSNKREIKRIILENGFIFFSQLDNYLDENEPILATALMKDRELKRWVNDYIRSLEHEHWYSGEVVKSMTVMKNNGKGEVVTEKRIFNREIKVG